MGLIIVDGKARTFEEQLEHLTKAHQKQKEINYGFADDITELNEKLSEGPTPEQLLAKLQPEYGIAADLSEDGKKVEIHLDVGQYKEKVVIHERSTATSGTLPYEDYFKLVQPSNAFISFADEEYYLSDDKSLSGYMVFTHVSGDTNSNFFVKSITVNTHNYSWVLTKKEIGAGGGGKVFHNITMKTTSPLGSWRIITLLDRQEPFISFEEWQEYTNDTIGSYIPVPCSGYGQGGNSGQLINFGSYGSGGAPMYLNAVGTNGLSEKQVFDSTTTNFHDVIITL